MKLQDTVELDENEEAYKLFLFTSKAMERARKLELERLGLSPTAVGVLHWLKTAKEPVTPTKLARWLYRETHTMSGLINRMEKKGLVKKSKDLEIKNLVRVTLTEKGERAFQKQLDARVAPRIMSCLSKKERDNLKAYLNKLETRALETIRDLQPPPYT